MEARFMVSLYVYQSSVGPSRRNYALAASLESTGCQGGVVRGRVCAGTSTFVTKGVAFLTEISVPNAHFTLTLSLETSTSGYIFHMKI